MSKRVPTSMRTRQSLSERRVGRLQEIHDLGNPGPVGPWIVRFNGWAPNINGSRTTIS